MDLFPPFSRLEINRQSWVWRWHITKVSGYYILFRRISLKQSSSPQALLFLLIPHLLASSVILKCETELMGYPSKCARTVSKIHWLTHTHTCTHRLLCISCVILAAAGGARWENAGRTTVLHLGKEELTPGSDRSEAGLFKVFLCFAFLTTFCYAW